MHTKHLCRILALAALALLAGCVSSDSAPQENTKYTVENTDRFELINDSTPIYVSCTGLQEHVLSDGRLEVVANIRNRENRVLQVEVSCAFRDAQGFLTGDETAFQPVQLAPNATEVLNFRSTNALAKKYTIRLREAKPAVR